MTNPIDVDVWWVLPAGVTLEQAEAAPGSEGMFPQAITTLDTAPCGSVLQGDDYTGDFSFLGNTLEWINGQPEDHAVYVGHVFVATPECVVTPPQVEPPVLVCPEGTVPGWLDESGQATSCVSDNPQPTPSPEPTPTPTPVPVPPVVTPPPTVTEVPVPPTTPTPLLAETGIDPAVGAYVAFVLLIGGASLLAGLKWKRAGR